MQHLDLSQEKLLKAELDNLIDEGSHNRMLLDTISKSIHKELDPDEYDKLWGEIDQEVTRLLKDEKEPSSLQNIRRQRKSFLKKSLPFPELEFLPDKVYGAWLARCVGCTLGKPVEGWAGEKIKRYLESAGAYPLHSYIPAVETFPAGLELWENYKETTLGNITRMVRDDDIDYTVIGLKVLETFGRDFTSANIGKIWLENLPFGSIFTAEAISYRNMLAEMAPPRTATYRNPYREYIGAQIRGDMWGYVNPGDPASAAAMAYRDACV